jgi:NHLM bacteriocin system ABC transporter peptidase/ATP-binding protein
MNKKKPFLYKGKKQSTVPLKIKIQDKESGAMAMAMIFEYYGLYLNREKAGEEAGVSISGTTSDRLTKAFARNGFDTTLKKNVTDFGNILLPAIARRKDDQFCVITKITKDKIHLNDPVDGRVKISHEAFREKFSGELIEVYPNELFQPSGQKDNLLSCIKRWIAEDKYLVGCILIFGLILIVPNVIFPASYKIFLDDILDFRQENLFRPLILVLIALIIFTSAITFVQQRIVVKLEMKMAIINSANFFRHLLKLPLPFFLSRHPGELGKRIPLNATLALVFASDLPKTVINVISIVVYALIMLNYNILLTVIGVLFSIINLLTLKVITAKREALNQTIVQNQGKVHSVSTVGLEMIETIKSTASEDGFFSYWAGYQTNTINNEQRLGFVNKFLTVLPTFLKNLNTIIMICLGAFLVIYGNMTIGLLVAFQALMDTFTKPMSDIISNGGKLQDAAAALTTLQDLADTSEDESYTHSKDFSLQQVNPQNAKLQGKLEIRNLKFGYDKYDVPLIENFNLEIEPGKTVALVGSSGSGKSTVAKLITGIFKYWEGEILFDGKKKEDYSNIILSNSLSMVDQKVFLFSGTVAENVTMWNSAIPGETIVEAACDACIWDVIHERQDGLSSRVEEGGKNFSGGQQQRIEIARALVNNPSILILDEATSALDPATEKSVMNNLKRRACTTLIIAHRLSTIRDCDEIVVLDQGKIVQRGAHEELIKQINGPYYNLVKMS